MGTGATSGSPQRLPELALSCVRLDDPTLKLRVARWHNQLTSVGVDMPLFLVHDIGILLAVDSPSLDIAVHPFVEEAASQELRDALRAYRTILSEVAQASVITKGRKWRLSDELIVVFLLKTLGPLNDRLAHLRRSRSWQEEALPLDAQHYSESKIMRSFSADPTPSEFSEGALRALLDQPVQLLISIEQTDIDTLRLLGVFGPEAGAASAMGVVDLLNAFESSDAHDIANFSLDMLPSILETTKTSGQQAYSIDGYAGIGRTGQLDALLASELAYGDDLFAQRFVEREVFYYTHEKQTEQDARMHYICVDATASMRGRRSVFARGLALSLIRKLSLKGEDVRVRFFDSRLYDTMRVQGRQQHGLNMPYMLTFKGEHGRNYARVFSQLASELARLKRRAHRAIVLYIITHAECHLPLDVVDRLKESAQLYGVFMLPSQGRLDLQYLDQLDTIQVVDERMLIERETRNAAALEIVDSASRRAHTESSTDLVHE